MAGYINNGGVITANYEADGDMKSPWGGTSDAGTPVMATSNPLTGGITWTAAEFAAITPETGKFYLVEA